MIRVSRYVSSVNRFQVSWYTTAELSVSVSLMDLECISIISHWYIVTGTFITGTWWTKKPEYFLKVSNSRMLTQNSAV